MTIYQKRQDKPLWPAI